MTGIARDKKLKELKAPKDYTKKNTDIPVYKAKDIDVQHRKFTDREQQMIAEFLAKNTPKSA